MTEIQSLLIGAIVGIPIQLAASILRYNGKWATLDPWRKVAMAGTGGIAAFAVGLWYLSGQEVSPGSRSLYQLWLYQTAAAWGGALLLDVAAQAVVQITGRGKSSGGDEK